MPVVASHPAAKPIETSTVPHKALLPTDRWSGGEVMFWIIPALCYVAFPGYLMLGSQILIAGLFALSLDLVMGYAGLVSLGHAAFFGTGAYTAGLLASHGWNEPIFGLLSGSVAAAIISLPVSLLVVRGQDLGRLIVTLGIGMLFFEAANKASFVTGGVDGLSGMKVGRLFGLFAFDLFGRTAYLYSYGTLFLLFLLCRRLVHSPFGLSLRAIKENKKRMGSLGVPVQRRLVTIFVVAAALAGAAGALLAQTTQFVGLDSLSFSRSAELLIMLVLGGVGRLYGGLIGAALFLIVQDVLAGLDPVYWQFWMGLMLVGIVLYARGGVLGGLDLLTERLRRHK
jgi:branched-chain amino acid transport system permease protein